MSVIADQASRWSGLWFREGVREQCMAWVRWVLHQVDHPLWNKVTQHPVDRLPTNINMASSLAGRDLGALYVDPYDLNPGDIIFWEDTYSGDWPEHTITHVGIYIGNGRFVHRPTSSRPVETEELKGYWLKLFRCALRPVDLAVGMRPQPVESPTEVVPKVAVKFPSGKTIRVDLYHGHAYAPVRELATELGFEVRWDDESNMVVIESTG